MKRDLHLHVGEHGASEILLQQGLGKQAYLVDNKGLINKKVLVHSEKRVTSDIFALCLGSAPPQAALRDIASNASWKSGRAACV